jgi:putative NADH-flavin reductase
MATIAIFGGTGYAGSAIRDAALVDRIAAEADVIVISIRFAPTPEDVKLIDAFPALTRACAAHGTRLGVVGGAASLDVAEGGPRLIDTPEFPDAFKPEAGSAASTLDALRADTTGVDWFFVSPAQEFGSYVPGEPRGAYRVGGDVLLRDEAGRSHISGADYALAFVDEIDQPKHHRTRFTVAY